MRENEKENNILDKIYYMRQYEFEEETLQDRKYLMNKLHDVSQNDIEKVIKDEWKEKKKIINMLNQLIENYEIKIGYYEEKRYKQGFKDGMNLYKICNQKDKKEE